MRLIEIPEVTIERELEELSNPEGPHSSIYAMGATAALLWLLRGEPPPSKGGMNALPVVLSRHKRAAPRD
jgi:hypothetical protein